jgi:hypothetical protein
LAFRQHGQVRRYGSRAQANSIFPERLIVGITRPPLPALLRSLSVAPPDTHRRLKLNLICFPKLCTTEGSALVEAPISGRW